MRTVLSRVTATALFLLSSLPITANTDPFSFGALTGATPNTLITSNIATITGFDSTASIRIEGGSYTIGNSVPTAAEGAITSGATVAVLVLSSSEFNTLTVATLTVGSGASATRAIFSVTTKPESVRVPNTINLTLSDTNADNPITITVNASDASGAIDIAELVATVVLAGAAVSTNGNEITYTPSAAGSETISIISINGIDVSGVSGSSAAFNVFHGALARIGLEPQNPTFLVNGEDITGVTIIVTLYDANNNLVLTEMDIKFAEPGGGGGFQALNGKALGGTGTVRVSERRQRTSIVTIEVGAISATTTVTSILTQNLFIIGGDRVVAYGAATFDLDTQGGPSTGGTTWTSSTPNVATIVENSGVVTIRGIGTTTITASIGSEQASITLLVNPRQLSLNVSPTTGIMFNNTSQTIAVRLINAVEIDIDNGAIALVISGDQTAINVGDYQFSVAISGSASPNYIFSPQTINWTINQAEQSSFAFTPPSFILPPATLDLSTFTTGALSTADIIYTIIASSGSASISNGILTPISVGNISISAISPGDGNYLEASVIADISIFDTLTPVFTLATTSITLSKNAPNTIRHVVNITAIVADEGITSQQATFSITRTGDDIFTSSPEPVISFATNSIQTSALLTSTPTNAALYFSITPDATGSAMLVIDLDKANGQDGSKALIVTVKDSNIASIISISNNNLDNISVFGGHLYGIIGNGLGNSYNNLLNTFNTEGGYLARVESAAELMYVRELFPGDTNFFYLGANDIDREGDWVYTNDNTQFGVDTNTNPGAGGFVVYPGFFNIFTDEEPNNSFGAQHCLTARGHDRSCALTIGAVFEFPNGFPAITNLETINILFGSTSPTTIANLLGFDLDGDNIAWSATDSGAGGSFAITNQNPNSPVGTTTISYQPATNFLGTNTLTIYLNKDSDNEASAMIMINVFSPMPVLVTPTAQVLSVGSPVLLTIVNNIEVPIENFSITPTLAAGLVANIVSNNIVISGTPSVAQQSTTYTLSAGNASGTDTISFAISIDLEYLRIRLVTPTAQILSVGEPVSLTIVNNGEVAPKIFSITPALAAGLAANIVNGNIVISGAPSVAQQSTTYTLSASNAGGTDTISFAISINLESLNIVEGDITATYGDNISFSANIAGATWASSDAAVANIDPNTGVVSTIGTGRAIITASNDIIRDAGGEGEASVTLIVIAREITTTISDVHSFAFNNTTRTVAVSLNNAVESDINSGAIALSISGANTALNAGTYTFTTGVSGSASLNYIFSPTTITWTIVQVRQSNFAFALPSFILPTQTLDLSTFTTGALSTADIIYTISAGSGSASISNSILTPISVGSISISAISPGDGNYLEASAVAGIDIVDAFPPVFTLATTNISLSKNAPNTIRHIVNITDIVADEDITSQRATFSITRIGDNIFTFSPEPVISFAINSIQTSALLTSTPTNARLYFSINPDTIGRAVLIITLDKANGQDISKALIITVEDSNTAPIISIADSRIVNFSVFGGHAYVIIGGDNYNNLLNTFDTEGGYLARVESEAELSHIRRLSFGNFYIGANDIASEGDWVYINNGVQFGVDTNPGAGGFVVYPGFFNIFEFGLNNEPNNTGGDQDCLSSNSGDIFCSSRLEGIFEFPNGFPAASNLGRVNVDFNATSPTIIANLLGFDLDGDETVWSATDSGAGGSFVITPSATTTISYQPAPNFHGDADLSINLNEVGRTDGASVVVMINVANPTPALVAPSPQVLLVGGPMALTIANNGGVPAAFDITPALPASLSINVVGNSIVITGIPIMTQQSTTYTLSASNAAGADTISFVISINLEPLSILEGDITTTYGDNPSFSANIGGSNWTSSDAAVASIDPNTGVVSTTGVGRTTITASNDIIRNAGGEGEASVTLIVTAREITTTIGDISFVFNNTTRTVAVSLNNVVESDINSGAISLSISGANAALNAGTYTFITGISGSASPNYIFSPTTITWTINQAEQSSFAFNPPNFILSTSTLDLSAFITGASSTADIIYTISLSSGSASINNSILTAISVGSISISAISPEDVNYLEASITADINIVDTLPFTLATHSIILSKNSPNTIRHIVAITDIITDDGTANQQATFSIARVGDIFTENPQPVISFATDSIQTSTSLTATPTSAGLYFSIAADATGSAEMVITLDRADGQDSSQTLVVTVKDSNQVPVISAANNLEDISVFGGHLYGVISSGSYNALLNDFDAEGGYLVRVESAAELEHIIELFPGANDRFYLGANDIASEGDWVYTNDGTQFGVDTDTGAGGFVVYPGFLNIFEFGASTQPNNSAGGAGQDCLSPTGGDIICGGGGFSDGTVFEFPSGLPATTNLGTTNIPFGATSAVSIANLLGFDLDGDNIVWSATDSGAGGSFVIAGLNPADSVNVINIAYQPAPDFYGNITLTISLNEVGRTDGASAVAMINVPNPVPDLVTPTAQVLSFGRPVSLTIINNGEAPSAFSITPELPASLSINLVGGNFVINGIPIIAQQDITYMLSASNAAGTGTISFVISINVAPLMIVEGDITATYGDNISFTTSIPGSTWTSSDPAVASIDPNTGVVSTIGVGSATIIANNDIIRGAGGEGEASITLIVTAREITATIGDISFVFNNTTRTVAVSLNNAVESDINSGAISLSISGANAALNTGTYTFTTGVSGSASPNYIFIPTTITWTINQAEQSSFAFNPPNFIPSTSTLDLNAFIAGAFSTADIIYTISSGSGSASISNSILTAISVGNISISAISPEDTNYLEASITADINIVDTLAFTLATHSIILSKNSPNTIRHIVAITDIVADNGIASQQATFSITRAGDNIFAFAPMPVISFATNNIQTSMLLTNVTATARLYFSIAADTIGSAALVIGLDKANGQDSSQTLMVTVQDSNTAPVISNPGSRRDLLADFSVFGGHLYLTSEPGTYQDLLDDFDAEGGYLVRVETALEIGNTRIFLNGSDNFYMGVNDIANEGDWVYTNDDTQFGKDTNAGDGGFVVYPGFLNIFQSAPISVGVNVEPDNSGGNQDCLNSVGSDIDCNSLLGGIFEFPNGFPATTNLGRVNIPFGATSSTIIANLLGFDLDGDETVWSATDSGAGGNIDIIGITSSIVDISYQPAPDFLGNITLTINLNEVGRSDRASALLMIRVFSPFPRLVTPTAQVLSAGEPVLLTIINNGEAPATFNITPTLPVSLSINEVGGDIVISGTPIIAQQITTYTLSTSNAVGTNTISFVISVNIDPLSIVGGDITANYGDDAISITSQGGDPIQPITWTSSIPTIATIDENSGVVTIINIGTTTITASRGSSQASISLLVNPRQLGLSVGPTDTLVFNNTNQTIAVSLTNAVESDINSGAISLTISGDQTAINAGNYQFSVSISGSASPNYIFAPTTISWVVAAARQSELDITSNATRLMVGQTTTATATNDQPQGTLTITSSEAGIATINGSTITATNVGITTITISKQVANYNNISASYQLVVIQNTTTAIDAGDDRIATYIPNGILSPQIPTNAQDRVISYAVDPIASDVVTIDSNSGAITIINVGTVSIIASAATTTNYAASTDSYLLTINQATQGTFTITASDTLTFGTTSAIVIVDPGSGDGTITYESSDIAIATITNDGIITATGVGEAIITVTRDGGRNYLNTSATHSLIVERADQADFVISGSSTLVNAQTSFATATGGSGTGAIVFSSSNPDIATISQGGIINAQSPGTTTISATKSGGDNYHDISDNYLLTITNTTPTVTNLIPNQIASLGNLFTFPIPANTFNDANGDTLTISVSALPPSLTFDGINSITGIPATLGISTITITADDGNGAMVSTSFSLTVSGDFIIVGSNLRNVVYGAASQNIIAQGGASPTGAITFSSSTPSIANFGDANIGVLAILGAGTAIITATRDGTGEQASVSFIVSPRTITPTFASPQTFIYNTNIRTVFATITSGIIATDDVSLSISGAATATDVGNYNIDLTLTGAASRNYRLSTTTLSWSIIKANQSQFSLGADTTITFGEGLSRPATGVSATVASSYGSSDPDVATVDTNGDITTTGVGSAIISTTNTGDNNYNSAADSYTLNVAPLTLTIAIGSTTTIYTGAAIIVTTTITNLVSGHEQVSLTISGDQTAINAGDYSFDISAIEGSDSPNYILIPITISWTIAPAQQSELDITGNATRLMVGQTTTATATNDQPQGTLTIISSEAGIATINGSTITATNVGITTITITKQVANHNNISARYQLVVIQNTTAAIDAGDNRTATYVPSGTLSAQTPTNTRGRVISYAADPIASDVATININTGAITITNAGTVNIIVSAAATTNYAASTDSYLLTINQANQGTFTITTSATLIFGATSAIVVVDPGSGEGTISYAASPSGIITIDVNGIISAIGVGEATITATKAGGRNYNDISTSASLEVVTDFNLDIDGDSNRLTTTDGILIIRFLTGSTDTIDTTDATTTDAQRDSQQILKFLQRGYDSLDIDGNGAIEANSDGMLIMRYLADQENLNVGDLIGDSPTRSGAGAISNYLESIYQ